MPQYFLPGLRSCVPPCFAVPGVRAEMLHPLVQHLLTLAPDRAAVLVYVEEGEELAEESALQQAGEQMVRIFATDLPSSYRERGHALEALFRTVLDHAQSLAWEAHFMPAGVARVKNTSTHPAVMAYIAAQHVVGARRAAMDLYNSR